ncbi:Transmembrane protein 184C [Seminavis robusta]|uniref:Transmembrane protein 184C n=1 Tax=Seminavis robusta TaxID=568900 RepID=A0A9N8EID4_9STRA|nr:Transmembrane protein 184C [Seminavis robusta]|eukprot:Sro1218_g253320.1 Transmembrane protein 184C (457) ;mRNA; f:14528-15998
MSTDNDDLASITAEAPSGGVFNSLNRRSRMRSCWLPLISFCNAVGLVGMGLLVAFLFFQLQYVTYKLQLEEKQIMDLQRQVQDQQAGQIQELAVQVEDQKSYTVYNLAGTFTLLTCLISAFHMAVHVRNMVEPIVQRKILAILWMSPIYSVTSFLSLLLPMTEGYLSIIKDFYEAYVVYSFLSFLISVLGRGDRSVVVDLLARHADHLDTPAKCLRRFYVPPPETSDLAKANAVLLECQIYTMQFVFVRPLTSIASFLVFTLSRDLDHDGIAESAGESAASYFTSPAFFIAMIENISVFFAFAGLLKFYHIFQDELAWMKPFNKFLAIKGIVFLTFWQGLAITIIVHLDGNNNDYNKEHEQAMLIQNTLICLEMLFFALAHWCVFPPEEWEPDYRPKQYARPGLGIKDFASDVRVIMGRGKHKQGAMPVPTTPPPVDHLAAPNLGDLELAEEDKII